MDKPDTGIEKTSVAGAPYRETRFRTPSGIERRLGMWVDRVGSGESGSAGQPLRILGQYALVAVERGQGRFRSPDTGEREVVAGDAIVLTPQLPAAYWPEPGWHTCWIVWNGPLADEFQRLGYLGGPSAVARHAAGPVVRTYRALTPLMQQEDRGAVLERHHLLTGMVLELWRSRQLGERSHAAHDLGERCVAYIRTHYRQKLGGTELARQFGLSPAHFRRLFKAYSGMTPQAFVTAVRMARAKDLLAAGASIKETSAAIGYGDTFYFMRVFRQVTGMPPGRFAALNHPR